MKIPIKKTEQSSSSSSPEHSSVKTPFYSVYTEAIKKAEEYGGHRRVLREFWAALYPDLQMPSESVPLTLIKLRLSYEFLAMDHKVAKVPLPEKVRINLEACKEFDETKLHKDMRALIQSDLKREQEGGEDEMAKGKTQKKASTAGRAAVVHHYLEIFENQAKAQLTDNAIAEAIEKKTGTKPTTKNVASYRCYYNQGKLEGQKNPPKEKLKAVREVKDENKAPAPKAAKVKVKVAAKKK